MSLRRTAISGFTWVLGQQFGTQVLGFIVSVILARILIPAEFGLIGMVAIFIGIGNALSDSGLSQSLIRSDDTILEDYSTVFYYNVVFSFIVYIFLYIGSPYISEFYDREIISSIIRINSVVIILNSFGSVQSSILTRKMDFKKQALISVPSTVAGGIAGIILAFKGFGVWSLVWSSIISSAVHSCQLWAYSGWRPGLNFNPEKLKFHFLYGYKLAVSNVLTKLFDNIYLILIGRFFSASQVGFYHRAEVMRQYPLSSFSFAINKVTFPLFARIKQDNKRLKDTYEWLMNSVLYLTSPVLLFMAVLGEPLFILLLTEKWLPAVPYFQIICFAGLFYPLHAYNLNILKVKGRSDLYLKISVIKKILIIVSVAVGLQFGIYGLLYSQIFLSVILFFLNSWYTSEFIKYPPLQQLKDFLPILLLSGASGMIVAFVDIYNEKGEIGNLLRLFIGGAIGGIVYVWFSYVLGFKGFFNLREILKMVVHGKKD